VRLDFSGGRFQIKKDAEAGEASRDAKGKEKPDPSGNCFVRKGRQKHDD
jgi:hypothetical protein